VRGRWPAPANTPDPAATPLTLHFADDPAGRIKRARVFIDNNPSPLVATFEFGDTTVTQIDMDAPRSEADNAARWYRSIVSDSFGV
jgi:predicted secreted protein